MTKAVNILSRIFGLFWLIFGVDGFLHFFPVPAPAPESAYFLDALTKAGYVMPLVYATEAVAGAILLFSCKKLIPLLLLAPITANIVLYDIFLNPSGLAIGLVIAVIHAILLLQYRGLICRAVCSKGDKCG